MSALLKRLTRPLFLFVLLTLFSFTPPATRIHSLGAQRLPASPFFSVAHAQEQTANATPNTVDCNVPPVVCKGGALTSDETWQAGKNLCDYR